MKKFILSVGLVAFAFAVQAGDTKACAGKDKAACSATKVSTASCCSSAKEVTCKGTAGKQTVMSPKGAEQAPRLIASR